MNLKDNSGNRKVALTKQFRIYDTQAKVFDSDIIIEAKTSRLALEKHLKSLGLNLKFIRSGLWNVRFKVREIGNYKKACWYQII